jgi:uncharacterized protein YqiB (DUF1249 family)
MAATALSQFTKRVDKMKRYTPDFPEMMRLCETNLPSCAACCRERMQRKVSYQVGNAQYRLTIVESTRYTTLVAIEQTARGELLEPAVDDGTPLS